MVSLEANKNIYDSIMWGPLPIVTSEWGIWRWFRKFEEKQKKPFDCGLNN